MSAAFDRVDPSMPVKESRFRGQRAPIDVAELSIDREGGRFEAGIMRGVSLIAEGEALGHGMWIDQETLAQVTNEAGKNDEQGLKARFTHPSMSSDGMGRLLGRIHDVRMSGDRVLGDLHFAKSAHDTPDGDLADYVMSLADEDPRAAGLSIVFEHDFDSLELFMSENVDEAGKFKSPDHRNKNNYPHVRLAELRAADVVDEPAANPDGLFDRQPLARDVDGFLAFAAGLSDVKPLSSVIGFDGDRAKQFFTRWLDSHGLSLTPTKDLPAMSDNNPTLTPDSAAPTVTRESLLAEQKRYTDKFGAENGQKWFSEGKTFEESLSVFCEQQAERITTLEAELKASHEKFASLSLGEETPIETGNAEKDSSESIFSKQFKTTPSRN